MLSPRNTQQPGVGLLFSHTWPQIPTVSNACLGWTEKASAADKVTWRDMAEMDGILQSPPSPPPNMDEVFGRTWNLELGAKILTLSCQILTFSSSSKIMY